MAALATLGSLPLSLRGRAPLARSVMASLRRASSGRSARSALAAFAVAASALLVLWPAFVGNPGRRITPRIVRWAVLDRPRTKPLGKKNPMRDPNFNAKEDRNKTAPLPWDTNSSEIMVDAMSVIKFYWRRAERNDEGVTKRHDIHSYWPVRIFQACLLLTKTYGKERPPSPWKPIVAVFDIPDPQDNGKNGLQVRRWSNLYRQGPRACRGVTLATAQTYVDQSAQMRCRCDKEILYMLEVLTRDCDRRQVLVTDDRMLARDARRFCAVRSPEWFENELLKCEFGAEAVALLEGEAEGLEAAASLLPEKLKAAYTCY